MMDASFMTRLQAAQHSTILGVYLHLPELSLIALASAIAYFVARHYIPIAAEIMFERNIFGIDINKTTPEERKAFAEKRAAGGVRDDQFRGKAVPESLGIVVGAVYFGVEMVLLVLLGGVLDVTGLSGPLVTVSVMLLLGFVDDVLDVRWRYKIVLSALGAMPLAMAYDGSLSVLVPPTVTSWLPSSLQTWLPPAPPSAPTTGSAWLDRVREMRPVVAARENYLVVYLGPIYLIYIMMLCIFCTNSINILAGVNGVEVGQSVVIAMACALYNAFQLRLGVDVDATGSAAMASVNSNPSELTPDHQIRALALLGPFIGVSLALWRFNRYPSRVFVGDSYTYFAGTVLAVAGITGVYTKTLLLFFLPQVVNFLISIPQLFNIIPCPRHRVPRWLKEKDVLESSGNLTILNAILVITGPMHESKLTKRVLTIQVVSCMVGFAMRYVVSSWMYDTVQ